MTVLPKWARNEIAAAPTERRAALRTELEAEVSASAERSRALAAERAATKAAADAKAAGERAAWNPYWAIAPLVPSPTLLALAEIIDQRQSKRRPVWRVPLDDAGVLLRLQPQAGRNPWFEGHADFRRTDGQSASTRFRVTAESEATWMLKMRSGPGWSTRDVDGRKNALTRGLAVREAIVSAFRDDVFAELPVRGSGHCLLCGKAMTDPISQARMIGPECYGSGTIAMPLWQGRDRRSSAMG